MYFIYKKHHKINIFKRTPPKIPVENDIPKKKKKIPAQIGIPIKIVDKTSILPPHVRPPPKKKKKKKKNKWNSKFWTPKNSPSPCSKQKSEYPPWKHQLAGQIISKSCSFSPETEFTLLILASKSEFS